jgi:dTMP kinase
MENAAAKKGKFIVIEGPDSSGKSEQFKRLTARLANTTTLQGMHFPQYEEPSSHFVREYLAGNYGTVNEIGPRQASLFYALDRFDASKKRLNKWLENGDTIVLDRYVGSNMGHQGSKIDDDKERSDFFKWLYELEFGILKIPKPDLNIILHVPAQIAYELRQKQADKGDGSIKNDIHEQDLEHLEKTRKVYLQLAKLFPEDFTVIECAPGGKLMSIDEVHEKVWDVAQKALA